jgi:hypothetical protein
MKLSLVVLSLFLGLSTFAQPPGFQDLVILYADGKYDKCIAKAEKYTQKDDTKREPVPYVYMSMALFEISKNSSEWVKKDPQYARAFGSALRYAGSFYKKAQRKDGFEIGEYQDHLDALALVVLDDVQLYWEEEQYSKAASEMGKLANFAGDNAGVMLLKGVSQWRNRVKGGAKLDWKIALPLLDSITYDDVLDRPKEDIADDEWERYVLDHAAARTFYMGITEMAILMKETNQMDKAREYIEKGYIYFDKHPEYKKLYDEIVN